MKTAKKLQNFFLQEKFNVYDCIVYNAFLMLFIMSNIRQIIRQSRHKQFIVDTKLQGFKKEVLALKSMGFFGFKVIVKILQEHINQEL